MPGTLPCWTVSRVALKRYLKCEERMNVWNCSQVLVFQEGKTTQLPISVFRFGNRAGVGQKGPPLCCYSLWIWKKIWNKNTVWRKITQEVIDLQPCKHSTHGSAVQVSESAFSRGSQSLTSPPALGTPTEDLYVPKPLSFGLKKKRGFFLFVRRRRKEKPSSYTHKDIPF